jgi:hypothetical protein
MYLVTQFRCKATQLLFQGETSMVGGNRNSHG